MISYVYAKRQEPVLEIKADVPIYTSFGEKVTHSLTLYIYICMRGAKCSVTRCPFGLLAASFAGTLRDSCGARAKRRYERKRNMQYRGLPI